MNDTFVPSLLLHTCLLWCLFVMIIHTTRLKIINCITHVMIILGPCRNNNQERPIFCVCAHAAHVMLHTHFLVVVGRCELTQFPQKWNNKSDWCWQRWFCNWVAQLAKLQSFQGMLDTGVRFIFNKFPPSNIAVRCFHTLRPHGIFSIGEVAHMSGRLWTDDERLWPVLAFSHLVDKKKCPNKSSANWYTLLHTLVRCWN